MLPNTSPKRSLKPGPITPCGNSPLISAIMSRTRTQVGLTSAAFVVSRRIDKDGGLPRDRHALGLVEQFQLLELLFDPVSDLARHIFGMHPATAPKSPWS